MLPAVIADPDGEVRDDLVIDPDVHLVAVGPVGVLIEGGNSPSAKVGTAPNSPASSRRLPLPSVHPTFWVASAFRFVASTISDPNWL